MGGGDRARRRVRVRRRGLAPALGPRQGKVVTSSRSGRSAIALLAVLGLAVTASAAHGGRAGRQVRVEQRMAEQVRVEAGWFVMGVPPSDLPTLEEECLQVSNFPTQHSAPTMPGGPPLLPIDSDVCTDWGERLGRRSPRSVWLDGFAIDRTEVTQGAYRACVQADRCSPVPLKVSSSLTGM